MIICNHNYRELYNRQLVCYYRYLNITTIIVYLGPSSLPVVGVECAIHWLTLSSYFCVLNASFGATCMYHVLCTTMGLGLCMSTDDRHLCFFVSCLIDV